MLIGQTITHYHILKRLGEGGMAEVYKAVDLNLDREVAIKFLRTDPKNFEKSRKRFELEAKALAKLDHPNIVRVLDYGDYEGRPYLVMEYIPGGNLKQRLGKPMPWKQACTLLIPIAEALQYAHERKIIHRDVKPSNILLKADGTPMLSDFGVAKMLEMEETLDLTGVNVGIGTPYYISPEQCRGGEVDHRSDVYSLGIVLYEMVTGRKPYQADTWQAIYYQHLNDPLPRPSDFVKVLPLSIDRILFKALAKRSEQRYTNMQEFVYILKRSLDQERVSVKSRRIKNVLLLGVGGVFVLLFFVIITVDNGVNKGSTQSPLIASLVPTSSQREYSVLYGHSSVVTSIAWSPDGKKLASGSRDDSVRLWDINKMDTLAVFKGHSSIVTSVAWSFDGSKLASSSWDDTVRIWDIKSGDELIVLEGHNAVISVAWSPDGTKVVTGNRDETIRIWDTSNGEELNLLQGQTNGVSIAWSPDGSKLAGGGNDNNIHIWNAASLKELAVLQGHSKVITSVAWSPDGRSLASGSDDNTVRIWDTTNMKGEFVLQGHSGIVSSIPWSPNGKKLASGSYDNSVRIWDATTGEELAVFTWNLDRVMSLAWSPDGRKIACGSWDNKIIILEIN